MIFDWIDIDKLIENPKNPRQTIDAEYARLVRDLRATYNEKEIIKTAILVRKLEDGKIMLIDGHHRVRAMKEIGITKTPAIIAENYKEGEALADLISMNEPVAKLDDVKVAKIIGKLRELGWSWDRLTDRLGYDKQTLVMFEGLFDFDFDSFEYSVPEFEESPEILMDFIIEVTKQQGEIIDRALETCVNNNESIENREMGLIHIITRYIASKELEQNQKEE